jgi:hypothetical protein
METAFSQLTQALLKLPMLMFAPGPWGVTLSVLCTTTSPLEQVKLGAAETEMEQR